MASCSVKITGEGVAAYCSESLLGRAGYRVLSSRANRSRLPAIMVSEGTQRLMQDVFDQPGLFAGLPRICKRIVAWGPLAAPREFSHSAVVLAEKDLLERLRPEPECAAPEQQNGTAWTIATAQPLPFESELQNFGCRTAVASTVTLQPGSSRNTCWVESLQAGWLFLLPGREDSGSLLSVGDSPESLLLESRLVARQIAETTSTYGSFPCHPRITNPLCGPGWLACGTAGVAFDPLCGDGTGNAIREAILASAVVQSVCHGGNEAALLAHYQSRLLAGFSKHLMQCDDYYQAGNWGPWWDQQLAATRIGLEWCARQRKPSSPFLYRLNGFALEPLTNEQH